MNVLVLNSGSSSQKSCLYQLPDDSLPDSLPEDPSACFWEGKIEWENGKTQFSIKNSRGVSKKDETSDGSNKEGSREAAVERLLHNLWDGEAKAISSLSDIDVVGHRVVHGGPHYFDPTIVTGEVKSAIEKVSVFAPLHNRAELQGMEIVAKLLGPVPQVAVFDTGFHQTMPLAAKTYPGPYEWFEQGIRRYGFHGINHQYCAERAAQLLRKTPDPLNLVTCHLGNGCSLAAIRGGQSIDTTMGFTPLEGLMMGTRSGSVDPGILTYLMREKNYSGQQLDELLNQKSGLLGISGFSSDMREILAATKNDNDPTKATRGKLALDIYIHRLQSGIGSMISVLGGVDALIFTAGVGENSPEIRSAVCNNLAFLGLTLNQDKNAQSPPDQDISTLNSKIRVLIIQAQEDWMIAKYCWKLLKKT
jgi:acetate kinase